METDPYGFSEHFFTVMSEFPKKELPPISIGNLIIGYELDDIDLGPGSFKAQQARAFFGEISDGIRLKLDDVFQRILVSEDTTPVIRSWYDETPTRDQTTSPVFLLTTVHPPKAGDETPVIEIIDEEATYPFMEVDETPVYLPPVVPKGYEFDFCEPSVWIPVLATDGFTKG